MARKDQRGSYRDERGTESRAQDYRGEGRYGRQRFDEYERPGARYQSGRPYEESRSYEDRDRWREEQQDQSRGEWETRSGRQYEGGGSGYGRQDYSAGQAGQGYYGSRPADEGWTGSAGAEYQGGTRYGGGSSGSPGGGYGYGRQGHAGQSGQGYSGAQTYGESGKGYISRQRETMGQYVGRGPRNYVRSDDRIQDDICQRLTEDPEIDATGITVEVSGGEVTLAGTVSSRDQRRHAEDAAERVSGVSHVQNNIRVSRSEGWSSGQEIARDETDSLISSDKVVGTAVYGLDRQKVGKIETVMLTKRSGKVAYAVLSFGGFLGLGSEYYPLPWRMLKYDTELGGYVVNLTKERLESAPKYGQNDGWDWNDPARSREIDMYYGRWAAMF